MSTTSPERRALIRRLHEALNALERGDESALRAEVEIVVRHELSLVQAHAVAVEAEHRLIHELPRLRAATVHADPDGPADVDHHAVLLAHR